jgi:hypothetical protein
MTIRSPEPTIAGRLRSILLELARREDALAADEAAATPYWAPCPSSSLGHRIAAALLRAEADRLLETA